MTAAPDFDPKVYGDRPRKHKDNGQAKERGQAKPVEFPRMLTAEDFIAGYVPQRPLIKAWDMKSGWLYSLTAPTGGAKTAIALAESFRLAGEGKRVLYLAGENPDDVRGRTILMKAKLELDQLPKSLFFCDHAFNLHEGMDHVRGEVQARGGVDLIFVDTSPAFQVASGAVDENSNPESIRWAMRQRELTGLDGKPAVVGLCHPIKRPQSIEDCLPRGGGGYLAQVDGNYAIWQIAEDGDDIFFDFRWVGKFRGSFEPLTYYLQRATCPELLDVDGNPVKSVWARRADEQQMERAAKDQAEDEAAILIAMTDYPGKSLAGWAKLLGWKTDNGNPAKNRVDRGIKRLAKHKLVRKGRNDRWHLLAAGKKRLSRSP